MKIDEGTRKGIQGHFGYSDKEMELFVNNPRNLDVMSKAPELMSKTIIIKVIEAHGCNSGHKAGDRFVFDGAGNLITKLNPKKVCLFALSALLPLVNAANELIYAGVDPNGMRFKRTGCFDTGIHCGGWGHILMEIQVEERKK